MLLLHVGSYPSVCTCVHASIWGVWLELRAQQLMAFHAPCCADLTANDDAFTVAVNKQLATNVSYNDEGIIAGASYSFFVVGPITLISADSVPSQLPYGSALYLTQTGLLFFNPAAASTRLAAGAAVAFNYTFQRNSAGSVRSSPATVTITLTEATGPFPPPPAPPAGTGAGGMCM